MQQDKKLTISVIGNGFVGNAVAKGFLTYNDVKVYDIDPRKSTHSLDEAFQQDVIFVCLPSPMRTKTGGDADLTIINNFFEHAYLLQPKGLLVLKSTVPVGTTRKLIEKYPTLNIAHNPEFLSAKTAEIDYITPSRHVIGVEKEDHSEILMYLFQTRFPSVPCFVMNTMESEMVKYMCNTFFATKIMFFNEMKMLCDKMRLNWNTTLDGMLSCGKIGLSHTIVAPDGAAGFGNFCFVKDLDALIHSFEKEGLDPKVLKAVWEQNLAIRPKDKWDW